MARALRRTGLSLGLPALVGASTVAHWAAGRRIPGLWIMPDEAIYAERAVALWRHGSLPLLHGEAAGYGVLYPLIAGLPFSVGSFAAGYASLKLFQALVVSLVAVPVFAYLRRMLPPAHALLAAALCVCSPLLLYSGLVMTEVLYLPLAAATVLGIARAVETAARRDQALALALIGASVLTRVQAVVFVGVFACAVLADAAARRDRGRLRAFTPLWLVLALSAVAAVALPGLFGAYAGTLRGSYPLGAALRFSYYHLAYAIVSTAVVPTAAALVLAIDVVRTSARDRRTSALVWTALATLVLVSVQVGFFSARFAPHLLGRDLAAVPVPLFACLAVWAARPPAIRLAVAGGVALVVLACLVFAPWNDLVVAGALPDTFGSALLNHGGLGPAADVVALGAAALLLALVVVPRRFSLVLPALVAALLAASSVVASNVIAARARSDQAALVGAPADWIDRAAKGPVTYVYAGAATWNVVWQQRFWNRRVRHVVSLSPSFVPGPMPQTRQRLGPGGILRTADGHAVASQRVAFVGEPVARHTLSPDSDALVLWQLDAPPRVSFVTQDIKPNGDMVKPGHITVYDCGGGRLELTLLPKATDVVEVLLGRRVVLRRRIAGLDSWHGVIHVPPSVGPRICRFTVRGGLLLGSTVIAFERPG